MFHILYVDDDPSLLEIGKQFLERSGQFNVEITDSAPGAFTLLKSNTYDSIIADYQMPGMDGIEFLKKVRASGNTVPFILFTGRGREEVVIQALNEGADFYLQKGGEPKPLFVELSHKLRQAIQKRLAEKQVLEKEAQLRTLVDSIQVGIVTIDAKTHTILDANPKAIEMIGVDAGEITGKVCHHFICPANEGRCPVTDIGQKVDLSERVLLCRNQKTVPIIKSVVPTSIDGHDVLIESFFDISERKKAEEELAASAEELRAQFVMLTDSEKRIRESEEKFRGIFDFINDGIEIHEFSSEGTLGKFIEVNDVACRMVQFTREELLQRAPPDITTIYHSRPISEILNELSTTGHAIFETEHKRGDGTTVPVEISAHVSYLQGKRVVISVVRDISERIRTAHELSQKNLNLSVINELEREFAELSSGKRVEELAEKKLLKLSGAVVAVFLFYDPVERMLKPTVFDYAPGIRERLPGALKKLIQILGKDPKDFQIPVSEKMLLDMNSSIIGKKKTITELTYGQVQPFVSVSLHKLSGIDRFIHVAHILDGKLYGVSVIGLKIDQPDISNDLLESFAHIVAVSLRRQQAEVALRESEKFSRNLVEHLPDFILIYDKDGKILYANPASAGALGYDAEKLVGTSIISYVVEGYREKAMGNLSLRQNYGTAPHYEIEIINHIGQKKRVIVRGSPIQYNDVTATLLVLVDITERSVAEKALKESEQRMSAIFNSARVGIILIDAVSQMILQVNTEALNLIGASEEDVIGVSCHTFMCPAEQGMCLVTDPGQGVTSSESTLIRKDGVVLPVIKTIVPVEFGNKKVFIESFVDISKRKHADDSLRLANKKLSLLTDITRHDINNQLTGLNGFVELLHEKITDPALENYFTWITQASNRISSTIQFTKEYSGVGESAPAWQQICPLLNIVSTQVLLKGVTVKNDIPVGIKVFSDPLIMKVFYNLIENAVRYGGKKITTIRIYSRKSDGGLVIFVEDDGNGVPSEEKEKIFDWGFGKNTGLGLALSREILDMTGITIQENGEPGEGARFEIRIPTGYWSV